MRWHQKPEVKRPQNRYKNANLEYTNLGEYIHAIGEYIYAIGEYINAIGEYIHAKFYRICSSRSLISW